jgi:hypothetical protein
MWSDAAVGTFASPDDLQEAAFGAEVEAAPVAIAWGRRQAGSRMFQV